MKPELRIAELEAELLEMRRLLNLKSLDIKEMQVHFDRLRSELQDTKDSKEAASGCPCTILRYACRDSCSCALPVRSGGCDRCAKHGSREQRLKAAVSLVERLEKEN